jgi:hypothetical protein
MTDLDDETLVAAVTPAIRTPLEQALATDGS